MLYFYEIFINSYMVLWGFFVLFFMCVCFGVFLVGWLVGWVFFLFVCLLVCSFLFFCHL